MCMISRKIDSVFDEFYELGAREALLVDGAVTKKSANLTAYGTAEVK